MDVWKLRLVNRIRKCRLLADYEDNVWSPERDIWSAGWWWWSASRREVACTPPEVHIREVRIQVVHI
jgi:hypothetical protein